MKNQIEKDINRLKLKVKYLERDRDDIWKMLHDIIENKCVCGGK